MTSGVDPTGAAARPLVDRLLGFLGLARALTPGPTESPEPAVPAVLTDLTFARLAEMLREHDRGTFVRSALLYEQVLRDADLYGALGQRLDGLLGLPHDFEAAIADDPAAVQQATDLEARWDVMAPRPSQREMIGSGAMLGYAVGQAVWQWDGEAGELVPRLLPWPSAMTEYREWERRWYVQTDRGPLAITPGDGQWVVYTPRSVNRPYLWGAIRCVAEWYLRCAEAAGDATKHAEVHGLPVWLAELPATLTNDPKARAWFNSIRNIGRNGLVPLPQGADKATSYNLRLEAAKTDAYQIFQFLLRTGGGKFRLAILGQDLTSQNNQVGTNASSETGRSVTQDVIRADAQSWGGCLRAQFVRPWAAYRAHARLAPRVVIDAEPAEDIARTSVALKTAGESAQAWQAAGWDVDLAEYAKRFGVPGKLKPVQALEPVKPAQGDPKPTKASES